LQQKGNGRETERDSERGREKKMGRKGEKKIEINKGINANARDECPCTNKLA